MLERKLEEKFSAKYKDLNRITFDESQKSIHYEIQHDLLVKPEPSQKTVYVVERPSVTLNKEFVDMMNEFGNMGGFDLMIELIREYSLVE